MTLAEVCDLSYDTQRREIVEHALAQMQLAPHVSEPESITPPDVAVTEFNLWLDEPPRAAVKGAPDGLIDLLIPRRG